MIVFFIGSTNSNAQDDLIKSILQSVDAVNKEMLTITALSDEDENKIGEDLDKKIMEDFKTGKDKTFDIKKIFEDVRKYTARKKINYRYTIIKDEAVNAFAIAGGKIYILTGLIKALENEDEIAFVISHEMAHIELKHCINRVQYSSIASQIEPNLGEIVQVAYSIYSTPFTKYEEYEADDLGLDLMIKAGYNKQGAITFFEKLRKLEEKYHINQNDPLNDFISSHPTADKRIERIKNKN